MCIVGGKAESVLVTAVGAGIGVAAVVVVAGLSFFIVRFARLVMNEWLALNENMPYL